VQGTEFYLQEAVPTGYLIATKLYTLFGENILERALLLNNIDKAL